LLINTTNQYNNSFNLARPLAWFLREYVARTMPNYAGMDLKAKRMLDWRSRVGRWKEKSMGDLVYG